MRLLVSSFSYFCYWARGGQIVNKCPNQLTKPRQIVFPPFLFSVSGSYGGKHRGDPIDLSCFIVFFFFSFLSFLLFFFSSFFFLVWLWYLAFFLICAGCYDDTVRYVSGSAVHGGLVDWSGG